MPLNKQKGNMYGFVTHTFNIIKGKCPHACKYCYMNIFLQKELRLDEKEFKEDLGENNYIFVGSSCDMFAEVISNEWIIRVLEYCNKFPKNKYLFQSKDPERMTSFNKLFPKNTILATTIETNRFGCNYNAPSTLNRYCHIKTSSYPIMITIEPIIDFDLDILVSWIKEIKPIQVNIGADSKGHNLPEPNKEKVLALIKKLEKFTNVFQKDNLKRLLK